MNTSTSVIRILGAAALLTQMSPAAFAGAWTQGAGKTQVIVTSTYTASDHGFDANGDVIPIPRYSKLESGPLIEYGVTDWLTAMIQPQARMASIEEPTSAWSSGLGYTEFGGRARLWSDANTVFSGQVTGRISGLSNPSNLSETGNTDPELDMRMLLGRSFKLGTWSSFVDAQLGYRVRFDDPPSEFRCDLTLGVRVHPQWQILAQSLNTIADGTAQGVFLNQHEHKVQLTAVWDFVPGWSAQLGGIGTVAGENTLRERGVVAGLWHSF